MGKQKKKRKSIHKSILIIILICLVCLMFSIISAIIGLGFLIVVDGQYEWFRESLVELLQRDNHFDGDLWFSAVVSLIGAIISATPGLLCGVLALVQTNRLHKLDDRYHRPMIDLDLAEVKFVKVRNMNDILENMHLDSRQTHSLRETEKQKLKWLIDLKIDFFIKNEIAIKEVYIQYIDIYFAKEVYRLEWSSKNDNIFSKRHKTWDYKKQLKDGRTVHTLLWNFYEFNLSQQKERFWDELGEFALYEEHRNPDYSHMTMEIYMRVRYEYGKNQEIDNMLRVEFDIDDTVYQKFFITNCSMNGYFTYDL